MDDHSSQFSDYVVKAYEALAYGPDAPSVEERDAKWHDLFSSCHDGQKWTVSTADAAFVTFRGFSLAWERGQYDEMIRRCEAFFGHPELAGADTDYQVLITCDLAVALFLNGDQIRAVKLIDDLVFKGKPASSKFSWKVALHKYLFAFKQEPTAALEKEFTEHISRLIMIGNGSEELAKSLIALTSAEEMGQAFDSIFQEMREAKKQSDSGLN